ncbi:TolC family protein, partial [bacterium]|nr:TolC family protein [bacterium]
YSGIYTAQLQGESTKYDIENNAVTLISNVLNAYWGLVNARESLYALELSRSQADSLLAYNRKGLELGVLTESDVLEARSALLSREQEILDQRNRIREIEDDLKRILNLTAGDNGTMRIIPTDKLDIPTIELDDRQAIDDARKYRPDYLIALTTIKQNELQRDVAKNSSLPDLKLNASYQINSSGTTVSKDLSDLSDAQKYGWDIGLTLSYPFKNRNTKAALEKRQIDLRRSQLRLDELENQMLTEIRTSIRNVQMNREKLDVAALTVEVNEMKLKKEEERFRNQLSTSYLVLQYQKELATTRYQYQKALMDYTISILEYQRSKGTLLSDHNVNIIPNAN